jgi:hypothetical protein
MNMHELNGRLKKSISLSKVRTVSDELPQCYAGRTPTTDEARILVKFTILLLAQTTCAKYVAALATGNRSTTDYRRIVMHKNADLKVTVCMRVNNFR